MHDALIYWCYLPVAVLGSGILLDYVLAIPNISIGIFLPITLLLTGCLLIWRATDALASLGNGTPSPYRPAKKLVTGGIYRFCRHPMWLGYDLTALGTILLVGSTGSLVVSFPVFIMLQIRFLKREEILLSKKFNQAYDTYMARTPLLFPWPRSTKDLRSS